ncbi:MAG: hypothetical protein ABW185_07935, partial [Sedimenticola sp.]
MEEYQGVEKVSIEDQHVAEPQGVILPTPHSLPSQVVVGALAEDDRGARSWLPQYAGVEISQAQMTDDSLRKVIGWLQHDPTRPNFDMIAMESPEVKELWSNWDTLLLKNGVLYKKWEDAGLTKIKLIVPSELKTEVMT